MNIDTIAAAARRLRHAAEALQVAAEGGFDTITAAELWSKHGLESEADSAKIYLGEEFTAIMTDDDTLEILDNDDWTVGQLMLDLNRRTATF